MNPDLKSLKEGGLLPNLKAAKKTVIVSLKYFGCLDFIGLSVTFIVKWFRLIKKQIPKTELLIKL